MRESLICILFRLTLTLFDYLFLLNLAAQKKSDVGKKRYWKQTTELQTAAWANAADDDDRKSLPCLLTVSLQRTQFKISSCHVGFTGDVAHFHVSYQGLLSY